MASAMVDCPLCGRKVAEFYINSHIDNGCANQPSSSSSAALSPSSSSPRLSTSAVSASSSKAKPPPGKRKASSAATTPTATSSLPEPSSKKFKSSDAIELAKPLAERVRPAELRDFVGQEALLGENAMLRKLIDTDKVGSLILWGPPGTGKTTIARLIAHKTSSVFKELSATNATTDQLRKVFEEALNVLKLTGRKTLLFVDEIQRFSKSQQDNFLPILEAGTLSLIASTTENPSFRLNGALLSRCRVFVLEKLAPENIYEVLRRAFRIATSSEAMTGPIDDELLQFLSRAADGDARVALSSLELALAVTREGQTLTTDELKAQLRKAHLQYDRSGDHHYDTISALHKSVRGGDANAALYWLARMLQGGDDPLYVARRLIRMASEDVGLANMQALPQAVAAYQATQLLGMPECDCILAQITVMLAESPKSVRTYKAYGAAKALVNGEENYPVPLHIRNAPTGLMKSLNYGKDYKYNPGWAHPVYQPFLPPELEGKASFLTPESSATGKLYDEQVLREWEQTHNDGEPWEGRTRLAAQVSKGEVKPPPDK